MNTADFASHSKTIEMGCEHAELTQAGRPFGTNNLTFSNEYTLPVGCVEVQELICGRVTCASDLDRHHVVCGKLEGLLVLWVADDVDGE